MSDGYTRFYREVPAPNDCVSKDVYGNQVVLTKECSCCGERKSLSEFFDDKKKRGTSFKARNICCKCFSKDTQKRSIEKRYNTAEHKRKVQERKENLKELQERFMEFFE